MTTSLARNAAFISTFALLLHDSWTHPETHLQGTTWGMILHTAYWGSSCREVRRLLFGLSFFFINYVTIGWLCLTYFNPQLDTGDKVVKWGCTIWYSISRTVTVHVLTFAVHWALLLAEIDEMRSLFHGMGVVELFVRGPLPALLLTVFWAMMGEGVLGLPGLHWVPSAASCYNITSVSNEELTKFSEKFILTGYAVSFYVWQRLIRGGADAGDSPWLRDYDSDPKKSK